MKKRFVYASVREGFKKKINYFGGIFHEGGGGGYPPAAKIINFVKVKKKVLQMVQNMK